MRVRVLGAGIIGLACAEELVRRGHEVEVVDPAPVSGATRVAAGMVCPAGEAWHGEPDLLRLGRESARLWPAYAARLGVPLRPSATLLAGLDHGDAQRVDRQATLLEQAGESVRLLERRDVRRVEPSLARVARAVLLPDDPAVDPRTVAEALRHRVDVTATSRGEVAVTVVATGARLPAPFGHLVRRVRGEILRARTDDPPRQVVRAWVHGVPVYVVPRSGGEIVVGATTEEHLGIAEPTLGGVHTLLDAARQVLPGLDRAVLTEVGARDRPGTSDNLPLVGPTHRPDVVLAAGHFRHGVLLAPLTARLVADHLDTGAVVPALDPRRFGSIATNERRSPCT